MNEVYAILLSWAAHLSGYPMPADLPEIRFEQHEFFVENACYGIECNVVGWYNDNGIVYIDEEHDTGTGFDDSLVVHEFVHWLQDKSGEFDKDSCVDFVAREHEAYAVQNDYLTEATTTLQRAGVLLVMGCKND